MEIAGLIATFIVGLVGGGGIWTWLIHRDEKKNGIKELKKEMQAGFDALHREIQDLGNSFEEEKALQARIRILRFSDEVTKGDIHSEESFRQVMHDIDDYDGYCKSHPLFRNSRTVVASERVRKIYAERLEKDDFL